MLIAASRQFWRRLWVENRTVHNDEDLSEVLQNVLGSESVEKSDAGKTPSVAEKTPSDAGKTLSAADETISDAGKTPSDAEKRIRTLKKPFKPLRELRPLGFRSSTGSGRGAC
jgi:hypothetical protein